MKRVVFPISILILLLTAGCPPTGSATGSATASTLPRPTTECPVALSATKTKLPVSAPWAGQRLQRPIAAPGRAFFYLLASEEPAVYSVVIVDGGAVTARFLLDPNEIQDFINRPAEEPGDGGAATLSPVVKVKGPPRPLQFVVPPPAKADAGDPAYWARLACLAAGADASAGGGASLDK